MGTYVNTAYQPNLYSNYSSYGNGLSTGFSLSNYTDTSSIFSGQSMNTGYYSQQFMAPQQQNSNEGFMQQLVLMLVSTLLQRRQAEAEKHAHEEEETEIDEEDTVAPAAGGGGGGPDAGDIVKAVVDPLGVTDVIADVFDGW